MRWQAKTPKGDVMDAAIEEAQNAIQDAIVEEIGKDRGDYSAQGRVEWLASREGRKSGKKSVALLAQQATAPSSERKEPETFCWTLSISRTRSGWSL